jgi:hypothetical protein
MSSFKIAAPYCTVYMATEFSMYIMYITPTDDSSDKETVSPDYICLKT